MSVTLESVERINALKNGIEATTGETYADLTAGVQALKNGYGQSGGGGTEEIENLIDQSGVLESTDGTVETKVEELIFYSKLLDYVSTFAAVNWKEESMDFYINIPSLGSLSGFLRNNKFVKRMVGINTTKVTNMAFFLMGSVVEEIERPFDVTNAGGLTTAFMADYLIKIGFVENSIVKGSIVFLSKRLSAESIQSIFDGLSPTATGLTLTLPSEFKNADGTTNTEAEAVVTANIEEVDGVTRIKGKEGWTLVR